MAETLKQYEDFIDECIKQTIHYEIHLRGGVYDAASMNNSTAALDRILKAMEHLRNIVKDAQLLTRQEMERQSQCCVNIGRSDALQLKDSETLVAQCTDCQIDASENASRRDATITERLWNIQPSEDNMND